MDYEMKDGQVLLHRTSEEKAPLINRLRRIEGQVRGLQQMIENDRHCLDEVHQINAVVSALKEIALMVISDHLKAGLEHAATAKDGGEALEDISAVLRAAVRD